MNLKQQIQQDFKASVKAKFLLIIGLCLVIGACGNNVQSPVDASFDSVAEALSNGGCIDLSRLQWTRDPKSFEVNDGIITISHLVVKQISLEHPWNKTKKGPELGLFQ